MKIHIYFKNGNEEHINTDRVTYRNDTILTGTILIQSGIRSFRLVDIAWFWVEHE